MADIEQPDITTLTVQLLSAYVANNNVANEDLAKLILSTRAALTEPPVVELTQPPVYAPAVSVRKSLSSPTHVISLIDGRPYKTLKRHLTSHGLTPAEYRERYNLPKDYPMVAPEFSAARRAVAQRVGLGARRAVATSAPAEEAPVEASATIAVGAAPNDVVASPAPAKRGPKASTPKAAVKAKAPAMKKGRARVVRAAPVPKSASASVDIAAGPEVIASMPKPRGEKSRTKSGISAKGKVAPAAEQVPAEAPKARQSRRKLGVVLPAVE